MQATDAITGDMTMREILEVSPGAQRALFRKYHIGGCASCGFRPDETLAQVCARNEELPVHEVIDYLLASQEEDRRIQITPGELNAALRDGSARVVDVRTREEFEAARIEGSILLSQDLMNEILGKWDRAALTVFVDHQGLRAMDAAAYFIGHGFANARALRGGIDAWSQEIDPSIPRYHLE
ncbi:MAG TPA: rhodanese-like domain-containing protein [Chthoniobacteraceae bacterium]|jgi:rhodanese-related sulfurtransferase|nr:rhodanese-like domain-containing protein [Chthoniobacteraceae bacterium]